MILEDIESLEVFSGKQPEGGVLPDPSCLRVSLGWTLKTKD